MTGTGSARAAANPAPGQDRRELIVYATPTGPLADAVDHFVETVNDRLGPTTAQTYPPHCTLTGFFRRTDAVATSTIAEMGQAIAQAGPVPPGEVEVVALRTTKDWVGLELRSPWLIELTAALAASNRPGPEDDALRLKDWLHLSLAYGVDDLDAHGALATDLIDPALVADWEVAVWERHGDGSWTRHRPEPT